MKIIHLSDPHIYTKVLFKINSVSRFESAIAHILHNHLDADLFVITGDLTHYGDKESYVKLKKILDNSNFPNKLYPKLMIGNHDNREIFKQNFLKTSFNLDGFIQYFEDISSSRYIFLDTNLDGTDQGHLCEKRQEWLVNVLENTDKNQKIYIFMHHNPLELGQINTDKIGLQQKNEFKFILQKYKKLVKHIFFGHQHITASGNYLEIPFSSPRSTWSPLIPNFTNKYRLGTANTDPNYNVILIKKDSLIVHSEDFLKTNIDWFED